MDENILYWLRFGSASSAGYFSPKGIKRGGAGNSESRETRRASGDALYGSLSVSAEADCGPAIGTLCEGRCTHTFSACGCHSGDTPPQRLRQFGGAPPGG